MQNIKDLATTSHGKTPYQRPLKAVIATRSDVITYKKDNVEKYMMYLALCDLSGFVKATLYEAKHVAKIENESTVVVKNFIVRNDNTVALTSQTKFFKTSPLEIPDNLMTEAINSVRPATPPPMAISEIQRSPVKTMASVVGVVQQDELPRQVIVRGEPVPVRTVTLEQNTNKIKVSLWRKEAEAPIQSGDCVAITNLVVKKYQGENQLSSTTRTKVQKTELPPQEQTGEIIAFSQDEQHIELLLSNDNIVKISQAVLNQGLDATEGEWQATLETLLPIQATFTIKDGEAVNFAITKID